MKVIEIFDSIDGEGIFTGCLATFVRLCGCNLRCSYCDTRYSFSSEYAIEMSISEIVNAAKQIGNRHITLTGGEPLLNKDAIGLVDELIASGFIVNIETNGSVDVKEYQKENAVITMDYKTKSSGENASMSIELINTLRSCDILKIVCAEKDFSDIENILQQISTDAAVYISPIFGKVNPAALVAFMKKLRDKNIRSDNIRMQIQLHKIIWDPEQRGV